MTSQQRRIAIQAMIKEYTTSNTASKKLAASTLVKEGIYTSAGKLSADFGGKVKPQKAKRRA